MGTCYLIHLTNQVNHAAHYIGYTDRDVVERVAEHNGSHAGSGLVARAGGGELVRTWPNTTKTDERRLKDRKNARGLCPRCKTDYNARCARNMRAVRQRRADRERRFHEFTKGVTYPSQSS